MAESYLVTPLEIIKGCVLEEYVFIPDQSNGTGADLTGVTLAAKLKNRPGGTTLATFTCTADSAPPGIADSTGWVQIRLDNSETAAITSGYHRGTWALTASIEADNPVVVAAGPVNIISVALP